MAFEWLRRGATGEIDYTPADRKLQTAKSDQERALSEQSRREQGNLGNFYQNAIAGKGPSVAEQQMAQGRDQAIKAAMATAASGRGTNQVIANRSATQQAAGIAQQSNREAGMLRAQEQMGYANQYQNLLQTQRLQDLQARGYSIDEAKAQLAYEGQLQGLKGQLATAESQGNQHSIAGIIGMAGGAAAALSDERAKDNIQPVGNSPPIRAAGNMDTLQMTPPTTSGSMSFGSKLAAALGAAGAGYSGGVNGNTNQLNSQLADLRQKQAEEDQQNSAMFKPQEFKKQDSGGGLLGGIGGGMVSGYIGGIGSDIGMKQNVVPLQPVSVGASGYQTTGQQISDKNSKEHISNLSEENSALKRALGLGTGKMEHLPVPTSTTPAPKNELEAAKYGQRVLEKNRSDAMHDAMLRQEYLKQVQAAQEGLATAQSAAPMTDALQQYREDTGTLPTMSDKRAKNVSNLTKALSESKGDRYPLSEEMANLPSYSYNYKAPYDSMYGAGQKVGPMAQDMEKVAPIANTVETGPDGMKRVNTNQLSLTNTAAIGDISRRLKELEVQKDAEISDLRRVVGVPGEKSSSKSNPKMNKGSDLEQTAFTNRDYENNPKLRKALAGVSTRKLDTNADEGNRGFQFGGGEPSMILRNQEGQQYSRQIKPVFAPTLSQASREERPHLPTPADVRLGTELDEQSAYGKALRGMTRSDRETAVQSGYEDQLAGDAAKLAQEKSPEKRNALYQSLANALSSKHGGIVTPKMLESEARSRGVKVKPSEVKTALRNEISL